MHKEVINVLLASDDNYAQPLGVTLYSMMDNFLSEKYYLKVTILDGGITEASKKKLETIGKKFNTDISFIKISNEHFKNFPIIFHFSVAIYYRIIIPELFPKDVHKVIYLDCDILVLGNIAELYETDVEDMYLAAVKDFISDGHIRNAKASFYKNITQMFNSGILLMNLKKMREDDFVRKTLAFIGEHSKELTFPDQEALNYTASGMWLELDKVWNYQVDRSQEKIEPNPYILHYTNSYKPWHAHYYNYYQREYMRYMKDAWPGYTLKPVPLSTAFKQTLKHIPFSIAIVRALKKCWERLRRRTA